MKMHKPIHEIIAVNVYGKRLSLVVYEDGTCESLASALESRVTEKNSREFQKPGFAIENPQLTNNIFSFVKVLNQEKHFCYTTVDEVTLKPLENLKSFALNRYGQDLKLMGCTVTPVKSAKSVPALFTIWSDKRLFKQILNTSDSSSIGTLHAIVESINASNPLALTTISEDCIAIYACKKDDDGSNVILYNTKYKIEQSKVPFKVYLSNFKLWSLKENIFLALGEQLSVIPYRITVDQLSSMVGSQCDLNPQVTVEKEMINEDSIYEENLMFDSDQTDVDGMEFSPPPIKYNITMTKAKPISGADEVNHQLNELYREDLIVDLVRLDDQPSETIQMKLLSNIDESYPVLSENIEMFCSELEKYGCSEIEITDRVIPVLIKTNRVEDMGLLLKRYNHVSEQMLTKVIKYLLSCPKVEDESMKDEPMEDVSTKHDKIDLSQLKKFPNMNIFLSTIQSERRDVLSIALCCSFDSQTILKFLRKEITLNEMVMLMDHFYNILSVSFLDDPYDVRGNLVEGNDFDYDAKLFEWMRLLLDSHYQQILLSHDNKLHKKLNSWLSLVDKNISILQEMSDMRQVLLKLATNKQIHLSKNCNKWYSIEKLELY